MNLRALFLTVVSLAAGMSSVWALDLGLPTANDGLFTGKPERFYMHVDRWLGGVHTTPWEGGQYGYVRNPVQTPEGIVYTRFHAGIDIRPLHRDAKGNPLDTIHAIAAGRVVHTNPDAKGSNFGRYLVIEHQWDGCPYYSLYAHLNEVYVAPGVEVAKGDKIALMGYTGRGINRERAHLHLEVALLLNEHFDGFSQIQWGASGNRHGNYNGINLQGMDVARLFLEARANPKLTIPEFLSREEVCFHVDLPGNHPIDLLKRYPWMAAGEPPAGNEPPGGWRIFFSRSAIPLRVMRLDEVVPAIRVAVTKPGEQPARHVSGLLSGKGSAVSLSSRGKQLISLLTYEPQMVATEGGALLPVVGDKTHRVKQGDTLISIAGAHRVGVSELQKVNNIEDPKLLQVGQILVIPKPPEAVAGKKAEEKGGR